MDLSDIVPNEIVKEITHPGTGENIGLRMTLMSSEDKRLKRVIRRITDQNMIKNKRGKGLKAEDIEENQIELLAHGVTGWEWYGDLTFHGEKPEFTIANVKKVLSEKGFILSQIDEEMGDTARFFEI